MANKDEINVKFGRNLKCIRLAQGIYQKDLAEMIGISTQCMHNIENGRTTASIKTVWKLQKYLNIDYNELFNL